MSLQSDFQWTSAAITDVGKIRKINEDACLEIPDSGLWVVADGMGGHHAGDVASGMIVDSLQGVGKHDRLSEFVSDVEDRLLDVNRRLIHQAAQSEEPTTIGSTVVALLAFRRHCVCLWAGDSRAYRYRNGQLKRISQDHSEVEKLIEQGQLLREDAASHPEANVITRAVGASEDLYVDVELQELQNGDRFLLCSDGLDKEVTEEEISMSLAKGTCQEACQELVQLTLERGSRDNVTVIVIQFDQIN